jgi:5-methylcytosine-specific restriction endonuclease McrA
MNPFYLSKEWNTLKYRALGRNKKLNGGVLRCVHCGELIKDRPNVDHIIGVKKRPDLALNIDNLQVLHSSCHSKYKQIVEYNEHKTEIGLDGMPIGLGW